MDEYERTEAALRAARADGQPERASEALTALEKDLTAQNARRALARVCVGHARLLLDASAADGTPVEWRDRALRKAVRAVRIVQDLGEQGALALDAHRAHVDALGTLPGRLPQALERGLDLLARLEHAPEDTRRERAERWHDRGRLTLPWASGDERRRFTRDEGERAESALRKALALHSEIGDEAAHETAQVVWELTYLLDHCGAHVAVKGLKKELGRSLSPKVARALRRLDDEWTKDVNSPAARVIAADVARTARAMRALADDIDARPSGAVAISQPALSSVPRDPALSPGDRVVHPKYGPGGLVAIHPGERPIAEVRFDDGAVRKIIETALSAE